MFSISRGSYSYTECDMSWWLMTQECVKSMWKLDANTIRTAAVWRNVSIRLLLCARHDHLNCVNAISFSIHFGWKFTKQKNIHFYPRGNIKVTCERHRHWSRRFCSHTTFTNALVLMPLLRGMYWHTIFFSRSSWRRAYFHAFNIYTVWVLSNVGSVWHSISSETEAIFMHGPIALAEVTWNERKHRHNLSLKLYQNFNVHINFKRTSRININARVNKRNEWVCAVHTRKSAESLAWFTVIAHAPLSHTQNKTTANRSAVTWVDVQNPTRRHHECLTRAHACHARSNTVTQFYFHNGFQPFNSWTCMIFVSLSAHTFFGPDVVNEMAKE